MSWVGNPVLGIMEMWEMLELLLEVAYEICYAWCNKKNKIQFIFLYKSKKMKKEVKLS